MSSPTRPLQILLILSAVACAKHEVQTLADTFTPTSGNLAAEASSILFVPGIMGSELHDRVTGEVVWGTFGSGESNPSTHPDDLRAVALEPVVDGQVTLREDPEVAPGGELLAVELKVGGATLRARAYPGVFEGLMQTLIDGGGKVHKLAMDAALEGDSPVYAVGYDWRRSITAETGWFHRDVLAASARRKAAGLDPRVDIVAHSLGTQLVRWYLRHGPGRLGPDGVVDGEDAWDASQYVRQVILIAPPNMGEPTVLEKLLEGERPSGLLPLFDPVVTMSFPSLYEMLPRPESARVLWADNDEVVDLYDVALWERFGWGAFAPAWDEHLAWWIPEAADREARLAILRTHVATHLDHARRMHAAMDDGATLSKVPVHMFVGTHHATPSVLKIDRTKGTLSWSEPTDGDGTVSRLSALATDVRAWASVHFVNADHMQITRAPTFLEDAIYLLLQQRNAGSAP